MKTALVIGATGLVGDYLLRQLLTDPRFERIKVFTRRPTGYHNPDKLEEHIVDFDKPSEWQDLLQGDVLFSTLGTTLKQAGSQEAQYRVDYTYQLQTAEAAARNGSDTYVLVSSVSADPESRIFYSRMKGELERDVKSLAFARIRILQPGVLAGPRQQARPLEKLGIGAAALLGAIPALHKYRPVHGRTVAKAMINASFDEEAGLQVDTLEDVFRRAGE
ncbi:NAD-dependent epimerase/dehydratase family protein [Hymenobacter sp. CRA2]|uniref:NAD-dependent epimerase/dehydratase family protein n=1 Tax=Hymenobacter sp. CRA2 TaxID=1955620 RepID=UPI00098EDD16|nr:NAD-dependent epimerase/dehydratase family protein [Hymenobacter sp. CRA2]OON69421.1 NADH dehydrogenase [Hymenobacter sp. CRA2]